jgi:hypothetical protein
LTGGVAGRVACSTVTRRFSGAVVFTPVFQEFNHFAHFFDSRYDEMCSSIGFLGEAES